MAGVTLLEAYGGTFRRNYEQPPAAGEHFFGMADTQLPILCRLTQRTSCFENNIKVEGKIVAAGTILKLSGVVAVASESFFQWNGVIIKKEKVESQGKSSGHGPGAIFMAHRSNKGVKSIK